ncbi:MFS transporter [Zhihengliuella halotolerans]|uniref:MFS transporter n=1 Tax=Zhihengliuella halotolerans TaxID=370736 RepID=UPI0021557D70|nr:MFS transporter [Zhihengliuella halotolerans]
MSHPVTGASAPVEPPIPEPAAPKPQGRVPFSSLAGLTGRAYLPLAFVARLPLAFLSIGALTLVAAATGSYAAGGLAAAATGIGQAIGGPLSGYLIDRTSQRAVLVPVAIAHAILIVAVVWLVLGADPATGVLLVTTFLAGLTCPQVGSMSRVRWQNLTSVRPRGRRELESALSLESMVDELTFVLGPALVGLFASLFAPWLPLIIAAVLTAVMVPLFALHWTERAAERAHLMVRARTSGQSRQGAWTPLRIAGVGAAVAGMIGMGGLFGTISASSVAFAGEAGQASAGGLFYAAMGLASGATALSVSAWPSVWGQSKRWFVCALLVVPAVLLLHAVDSVPWMIAVVFIIGLPIGPVLVTVYTIGSEASPRGRLGTVMTLLASGVVVGVSAGNAAAGTVADAGGSAAAFGTVAVAAIVLFAASVVSALVRRRGRAR